MPEGYKVRRSEVKGSRAEALVYMPILRTNHVVQGFIPAGSWTQEKPVKVTTFDQDLTFNAQYPSAGSLLDYWKLGVDDWIFE